MGKHGPNRLGDYLETHDTVVEDTSYGVNTPCEHRCTESGHYPDHQGQHQPPTEVVEIDPIDELDQARKETGTVRLHS